MSELEKIIEVTGAKPTGPNQWLGRCPTHEDNNPSLSISKGKGGKLLLHDHSGRCTYEQITAALDLKKPSLNTPTDTPTAIYDYTDEKGVILYQNCRYGHGEGKTFKQRRPDGKGGWIWGLGDARRVPYGLPEILKADTVHLVEGEKDVETLRGMGLVATSSKNWKPEWATAYLKGKTIYIIPDNDEPGQTIANKVALAVHGVAASVKMIELPGLQPGGDVTDWTGQKGNTKTRLLKLIKAAVEWTPTSPFGAPAPIAQWLCTKPKPLKYIFEGAVLAGIVGGVVATGGVGKTYLLMCLAISGASGVTLFPAFRPVRAIRVLALLGEDPQEMIHPRFKAILKDKKINEGLLAENLRLYCGKAAPFMRQEGNNPTTTEAFDALRAEVEDFRPDLVIIDPKSMFYGLDENSNDHNTQWVVALKELTTHGATALYSHHSTKALSGTLDLINSRGGGALPDGSRFFANMRQLTDEDARRFGITEPWRYIELRTTKNSYVPRLPGSIFFEFVGGGALEQVDLKAQRDYELVETLLSALGAEAEKGNFFTAREVERSESILKDRTTRDKKYAVQIAIELGRLDTKTQPGKTRGRAVLTPRGVKF